MKKISWLIAILAVFGLLLVGCGGNGGGKDNGVSDPIIGDDGPVEIAFKLVDAENSNTEIESVTLTPVEGKDGEFGGALYIYFDEPVDLEGKAEITVTVNVENGANANTNFTGVYIGSAIGEGADYTFDLCGSNYWNGAGWVTSGEIETSLDLTNATSTGKIWGAYVALTDFQESTFTVTSVVIE